MATRRVPIVGSALKVAKVSTLQAAPELGVNILYNGELLDPALVLNTASTASVNGVTVSESPAVSNQPTASTDFVPEGASNLYFSNSRAQAAVGASLYATASGTNTYTASLSPAIVSYTTGVIYKIKFTNANTSTATLNLNGVGAKAIQLDGVALTAGQIPAASTLELLYDGTAMQIVGLSGGGTSPHRNIVGGFSNGSSALTGTNSVDVFVPYDFTIINWRMGGDGSSGSGTIDVLKATTGAYPTFTSITAAATPAVSAATQGNNSTLTGWTKTFTGGVWLRFTGSGFLTWTRATLNLEVSTP